MKLENHICQLLLRHDCVILPGFGGFIGNYAPATIHPTQHIFNPPSKRILFNRNLQNNDGLLASFIVQEENISFQEAMKSISDFTSAIEKTLKQGKKAELLNVGTLFLDVEKNLQFKADENMNFLLDSFGLSAIQSPAVKRHYQVEAEAVIRQLEVPGKKKNYKKYLAAAAITIPLLFGLAIIPLKTDLLKSAASISSFNPFANSSESIFQPRTSLPVEIKKSDVVSDIAVFKATVPATAAEIESIPEAPSGPQPEPGPNNNSVQSVHSGFLIIAGCFREKDNAETLIRDLSAKGFKPEMAGQTPGGLHRVSFGSFSKMAEAKMALEEIRQSENPSAWILSL